MEIVPINPASALSERVPGVSKELCQRVLEFLDENGHGLKGHFLTQTLLRKFPLTLQQAAWFVKKWQTYKLQEIVDAL